MVRSKPWIDAEKMIFDLTENLKSRGVKINGTRVDKPNQPWAEDNSGLYGHFKLVVFFP